MNFNVVSEPKIAFLLTRAQKVIDSGETVVDIAD
jgi:hypothetical protein